MAYIRTTKQFIAKLKQARLDQGLTQAQLGDLVGMSQKKIAMIENLTASPRLDILLIITSALDLNLSIESDSKADSKGSKNINLVWS